MSRASPSPSGVNTLVSSGLTRWPSPWIHDWGEGPATNVLIELTPTSTGTHLKVTHSGFASEATREDHRNGWTRVLGWLDRYLKNR
jgi:hypothetical protein